MNSAVERAIEPLTGPIDARVRPPGSKSYTNRALLLSALARGRSQLVGALFSEDTRYMADALRQLGVIVGEDPAREQFDVEGSGGAIPARRAQLFVGNAGTAARFLPAMLALGHGDFEIDGVPRMRERPIQPLMDALGQLGGTVEYLAQPGCLPVRIIANGLRGGKVSVSGHLSSQYLSGLLLSAPYMAQGLKLNVHGHLVSRPYIDITIQAMESFGVTVERPGENEFVVSPGPGYVGRSYEVEPDASSASYFFAAAAICGGRARVEGLGRASLQGDLGLSHILARMGCTVRQDDFATELEGPADGRLSGVDVNMAALSDVAQTLAIVAPFASSPTRITGIGFIRRKETDRLAAVVRELRGLGVNATEEEDGILVQPGVPHAGIVSTYDDHRMAMSFAVLGLRVPGVVIQDPACTAKTFPTFWDSLAALRGEEPRGR